MVLDVVVVKVPIEEGFSSFLQCGEQLLLYLLEQVEAHEEVIVSRKTADHWNGRETADHGAVECAFVCQSLFGQLLVEIVIDIGQPTP